MGRLDDNELYEHWKVGSFESIEPALAERKIWLFTSIISRVSVLHAQATRRWYSVFRPKPCFWSSQFLTNDRQWCYRPWGCRWLCSRPAPFLILGALRAYNKSIDRYGILNDDACAGQGNTTSFSGERCAGCRKNGIGEDFGILNTSRGVVTSDEV